MSIDQPAYVNSSRLPLIGQTAPAFSAKTTLGPINFPDDYKGKWVIFFSHPADFTPVCTTEFMVFASMQEEFKALNCELLGLSIDSNFSHIAWLRTMQERLEFQGIKHIEIKFPLIADLKMEVARLYGMIHPETDDTSPVRAVFFIDPESKIRALLYYPQTNGRNFQELKRLLIAMQTSDKFHCATPSNWQPGDDVIIPPPQTLPLADERVEKAGADYACSDWFLCFKRLPEEQLTT